MGGLYVRCTWYILQLTSSVAYEIRMPSNRELMLVEGNIDVGTQKSEALINSFDTSARVRNDEQLFVGLNGSTCSGLRWNKLINVFVKVF